MNDSERVLVTGGSGYIASFCIAQLLRGGAEVKTTVRNVGREAGLRASIARLVKANNKLEVSVANLNADDGWREACTGCSGVLHVASPFPLRLPKDDAELVRPAREGSVRVLKAARDAGVRRVVITSSTAAVAYGHGGRSQPFTEEDWSDPRVLTDSSAYERSLMGLVSDRSAQCEALFCRGFGLQRSFQANRPVLQSNQHVFPAHRGLRATCPFVSPPYGPQAGRSGSC